MIPNPAYHQDSNNRKKKKKNLPVTASMNSSDFSSEQYPNPSTALLILVGGKLFPTFTTTLVYQGDILHTYCIRTAACTPPAEEVSYPGLNSLSLIPTR